MEEFLTRAEAERLSDEWEQKANELVAAAEKKLDDFSDTLAEQMGESWDGEEAQEAIIERFMKRYGALDQLIDALDYEGEIDDVVRIEFNRSTFQWSITGVSPEEPDHDLLRKQEIEDRIARGDDL